MGLSKNGQIKLDIIEALRGRGEYFKQISDIRYRTRCPYCGDSQSNLNTGHFYLRIDPTDNYPILYICFKCDMKGVVTDDVLMDLDIDDVRIKSGLTTLNRTSDKIDNKNYVAETEMVMFDFVLPEIKRGAKTKYIENRLGIKLTDDELMNMKVVTSIREFLITNNIRKINKGFSNADMFRLEDHFVGFLTYGNSHILLRDITGKDSWRWVKYPITEESSKNKIFYVISNTVDVLTSDDITINLSEGVFDAVSICYNFEYDKPNTLNIAVSGKYYSRILLFLLDLGIVGSNVTVNIFSDNDVEFNKKGGNTTLEYYKKVLERYKYLFGKVNVYYNTIGKDYGVPRKEICLKKYPIS